MVVARRLAQRRGVPPCSGFEVGGICNFTCVGLQADAGSSQGSNFRGHLAQVNKLCLFLHTCNKQMVQEHPSLYTSGGRDRAEVCLLLYFSLDTLIWFRPVGPSRFSEKSV